MKIVTEKATLFTEKIRYSNLSKQEKWMAMNTILDPGVTYPWMATNCTPQSIQQLESTLAQAHCSALGLNKNFPCAILHGPLHLGGINVTTAAGKSLCNRLSYFLYHTQRNTTNKKQLEASLIYTKLEKSGYFVSNTNSRHPNLVRNRTNRNNTTERPQHNMDALTSRFIRYSNNGTGITVL
jgi:hypothetical protein